MTDLIKEFSQFSSEKQILLPMCNILPANQIITKKYEADQTPIMRLITKQVRKQKQSSNNIYSSSQTKFPTSEFTEYGELFGSNDFLGKQYAEQLNQMIYFKFNNKDYNQLKLGEKRYRFFSGFFIDKEHFEDVTPQKHDNFMKSFPQLDFVDYNANPLQSFGKNTKGSPQDPRFSSNYQSANLFAVIKKRRFEYDLILQNDMNSKGNNQWFNFLVNFTEQGTYKLNIVNFTKSHSLYEQGMRIACCSLSKQIYRGNHENQKSGAGWFRGGKNIKYFRNEIQRQTMGQISSYYTLSFQYTCKHRAETTMFAYTYPYTNLQLEKFFNKLMYRRVTGHLKMEKIYICNSVAGHPIYGYVISHRKLKSSQPNFKSSISNKLESEGQNSSKGFSFSKIFQKRSSSPQISQDTTQLKSVILMARQHSGEVQSSFVIEGIVDLLMANTQLDQTKKKFVFFVFPMVNVDGVKYGHYRTNLCGSDLNRIWRAPRKQIHPEVFYLKKLMYEINRNTPISLILDVHGHSKSLNTFFYGNPSKKQNMSFDNPKLFPFICSKRINQISYKQSTFSIREQKKNSARVVLSEMFPKAMVYTLENSFYGYKSNKDKKYSKLQNDDVIQYTPEGYRKVGRDIMSTFLEYTQISEKNSIIKAKWMKQMQETYPEIQKSQIVDFNNEEEGSDSELENQLIQYEEKPIIKSKTEAEEFNTSPRGIEKAKTSMFSKRSCIIRKTQKKKTMPLPKTICEQTVTGISSQNMRNFKTLNDLNQKSKQTTPFENKQNLQGKNPMDIANKPQYPQAVLSIFKIQTHKSALLRKKISINTFMGNQQGSPRPETYEKPKLSPSPNIFNGSANKLQKQSSKIKIGIHQRKIQSRSQSEKNLCVQDVINKCSGMKTFLKAMGITIQNRRT